MADLEYHIIHIHKFQIQETIALANEAYAFWKKEWLKIYANKKSKHISQAEDFMRYHTLNILLYQKQLIGMSAHTFYDLSNIHTLDLEFIRMFEQPFINQLKSRSILKIMTFETLLVNSLLRKKVLSLDYSQLLVLLGGLFFSGTNAQAMIATARNDIRASDIASKCGWEKLEANKICRGFTCDLIALFNKNLHFANNELWQLAKQLWQDRSDQLGTNFIE